MEEITPDPAIEPGQKQIPFWSKLNPKQKRIASISIISLVILSLTLLAHNKRQKNHQIRDDNVADVKSISLDTGMIENSLQDVMIKSEKDKNLELEAIKLKILELENKSPDAVAGVDPGALPPAMPNQAADGKVGFANDRVEIPPKSPSVASLYPPPPPSSAPRPDFGMIEEKISRNTALAGSDRKNTTVESTMVGGIESSPVEIKDDKKKTSDSGARSTIYLPPSFVEATLLSGVTAKTSAQAKNDPSPMLFRIKDLAILPNSVKANLKGCFVIGEGIGDLATERVDARIVTLSCVSKNEESVIDQAVKGWVEDNADGKVGLSGRVVSKMGMAVARSALAGFLGGFGNAMSATTQNTALSAATGVPTSVFSDTDMKNYTKAGVGQGVKGATDDLQKFYLGLAEQSVPSIEVLPAKKVTLVFSEGVELKIKDVNLGRKK